VIVVELNPDIVEPRCGKRRTSARSQSIRIKALRSGRNVIRFGSSSEIRSESTDESVVSSLGSSFDVKIDSIENCITKRSEFGITTQKHVPNSSSKGLSLSIRAESVIANTSAEREQYRFSLRLAVLNVRSNICSTIEQVGIAVIERNFAVIGKVHSRINRASGCIRKEIDESYDDDIVRRIAAIMSKRLFPFSLIICESAR